LLAFAVFAQAQQKKTIGVLPSIGNIDYVSLDVLTKELRAIAVNTLPSSSFEIMSQENIMRRLGGAEGYLTACRETEGCIAELGKLAEVDYVVRCDVNEMNRVLMMSVELYSTSTGGLVGSFNSYKSKAANVDDLLSIMGREAPEIFKKIPRAAEMIAKAESGILEIKPAYIDGIGGEEGWSLLLNGLPSSSWENELPPGNYDVRLAHRCYDDVSFMAGVARGSRKVFDMAGHVKLKMSGSESICSKIELELSEEAVGYSPIETGLASPEEEPKSIKTIWAIAANLVGAGLIVAGIVQDGDVDKSYKEYLEMPRGRALSEYDRAYKKVEDAKSARNGLYIAGGLVFAAGVVLWF
jgi:hypothetical protein